jgi:hypothetical protein
MLELTEQEKYTILDIAKRTSLDVDGDLLEIYVNSITGDVSVIERFALSDCERTYVRHDKQITSRTFRKRPWLASVIRKLRRIRRGYHDTLHF